MLEVSQVHQTDAPQILLAEDNLVNQRVVQLILNKLGHAVDIVGNGRDAVEAVKRRAHAVVLMDIEMPELDGVEATRRILDHFQGRQRPYIPAVTASEERAVCLAAGMDDYLLKPIRVADPLSDDMSGNAAPDEGKSDLHRQRVVVRGNCARESTVGQLQPQPPAA